MKKFILTAIIALTAAAAAQAADLQVITSDMAAYGCKDLGCDRKAEANVNIVVAETGKVSVDVVRSTGADAADRTVQRLVADRIDPEVVLKKSGGKPVTFSDVKVDVTYLANGACIGSSAPMREKIIDPKVICSNSRTM